MTCIQLAMLCSYDMSMLCSYDMYRPLFMPSSQPAIGYISTSSGLVNKFDTCWDVIAAAMEFPCPSDHFGLLCARFGSAEKDVRLKP